MYCQYCRLFVTLFLPEVDLFLPPELRLENKQKKIHCKYYQMAVTLNLSHLVSGAQKERMVVHTIVQYCSLLS